MILLCDELTGRFLTAGSQRLSHTVRRQGYRVGMIEDYSAACYMLNHHHGLIDIFRSGVRLQVTGTLHCHYPGSVSSGNNRLESIKRTLACFLLATRLRVDRIHNLTQRYWLLNLNRCEREMGMEGIGYACQLLRTLGCHPVSYTHLTLPTNREV